MKSDWLTLLQSATAGQPDKVPAGFRTRPELQKEIGCAESTLSLKLRSLESSGKVEKKMFRVKTLSGVRAIPHWRIMG